VADNRWDAVKRELARRLPECNATDAPRQKTPEREADAQSFSNTKNLKGPVKE
jgi:hypothetical protein